MSVVIVAGMPDEKRVLTNALKPGTLILSGTDKLKLPELVPSTCTRLVCLGVCGGLAPDLVVPDVAMATAVLDRAGAGMPTDPEWNAAATSAAAFFGIKLHPVPYYSSGLMDEADTKAQRAALFAKYGAHAIDDESRYVVAEAVRRGVPFNVVRPLSDDWSETLPLSSTGPIMNRDGSANIEFLLRSIGQDQGQDSVSLFRVAIDYSRSLDVLEALAKALASLIASEA